MDALQRTMDKTLQDLPRVLLADLLDKKLRKKKIRLSKSRRLELASRILTERLDFFEFDDGKARKGSRKITLEFTEADTEHMEKKFTAFMDRLPTLVDGLTDRTAQRLLAILKRKWRQESKAQRRDLDRFRKNLNDRWGKGLEKLRMLITISREFGSDLNAELGRAGGGDNPKAFEILIKLHARSCQLAEELVCLLSNGFADGAMARWRTLHEVAAVAYLIQRHGDALAYRYADHQIVESRKAALQYQRYQARLKQRSIPDKTLKRIEEERARVLAKYGPDFANSQGWAAFHLGKRDPSFADIQEAAGIDHLAPYYRMASHNIHANPKGVFFKLGLIGETNTLLAGPSNAGLTDPGHATAVSLAQICSLLMQLSPTLDRQMAMKVMMSLKDEIGDALFGAHKQLEADEKVLRGDRRPRTKKCTGGLLSKNTRYSTPPAGSPGSHPRNQLLRV